MMDLSMRQRAALAILLRGGPSELTLAQVAAGVGVSARTIHRELARVAPLLREAYGLTLSGKTGQGIAVSGPPERVRDCLADLEQARPAGPSEAERRRMLQALLLEGDGVVKLQALESALGAGPAAVRHDLDSVASQLAATGLSLSPRRGIGVVLEGSEAARRQALLGVFLDEFGEAGILDLVNEADDDGGSPAGELLLRVVPPGLFQAAESVLSTLPRELRLHLAPRDYLALVALLAIGVARRRAGFRVGPFDGDGRPGSDSATLVEAGVAAVAGLEPDPDELAFTRSVIRGAKPERPGDVLLGETDLASVPGLRDLIRACGEAYGEDFGGDPVLRDGLAAHWGPALHRLRAGLPIRNPLLAQIRERYARLFDAVQAATARTFPGLAVPDDEIAYLVLHFGSSLERRTRAERRFRALVVCSAGIGSAHMLASRIHAELPEIDVVASLSWFDVERVPRDEWDLLVSTIQLPLPAGEYIVVSPLMPREGIEALRTFIAKRRESMRERPQESRDRAGLVDLRAASGQLAAAVEILEGFRVLGAAMGPEEGGGASGPAGPAQGTQPWPDFLGAAVARVASSGALRDEGQVLKDLSLRSSDGGIVLPGSAILFLHARTAGLERPSLSLHLLDRAPAPPAGLQAPWERPPTRLVLMLAPPGIPPGAQDILNEISSSFLDPGTVEVLQSGEESEIRRHYSRHLDRFARSSQEQGAGNR